MKDLIALLEDPNTTIALVGATDNPSKYGHIIYRDLKRKGFTVYPINSGRATVDGDQTYATVADIQEKPTIVNIVIPPNLTINILQQCLKLNLMNVWIQPGAESPEVITFLQNNDFNYIANDCIMVRSRMKVR